MVYHQVKVDSEMVVVIFDTIWFPNFSLPDYINIVYTLYTSKSIWSLQFYLNLNIAIESCQCS